MSDLVLTVSDFVAVFNQTLEYAYPSVSIVGELANFRISKNRWVYFDLKDEYSSVKFFGTVYQLPGPLEDGLMIQVTGQPRLHQLYGFSVNIQSMQPVGEGSLRRAADLLQAKLSQEGLFDDSRKRTLPYPPQKIGIITSGESAAYKDFTKIITQRWPAVEIQLADVQVQGEIAPSQITEAIEYFNTHAEPVDVLVITRGGGSAEDLAAFNTEQVTRAVAGSRIPTIVAIGHEVDICLAELAADVRASTPSNAAELLVPDQKQVLSRLSDQKQVLETALLQSLSGAKRRQQTGSDTLHNAFQQIYQDIWRTLRLQTQLLEALSPQAALRRGYAVVKHKGQTLRSISKVKTGDKLTITLADGQLTSEVQ